jgi:hypothetical protein
MWHVWVQSVVIPHGGAASHCVYCVLQVVDPVAAAQPAARSKDLMRAMKEAAQGMRGGREVGCSQAGRSLRSSHGQSHAL